MSKAYINFCRYGIQGFFKSITEKPYVLDKSRGWGIEYNLLEKIFPNPKVVCVVRDIRSIYSSMEKNFRKNPHLLQAANLPSTTSIHHFPIPVPYQKDRDQPAY